MEQQDYPKAFGIWRNDANWQLHQERFSDYPYTQFLKDWGPTSDFRVVNSHKILYTTSHLGNVVLLAVEVHASNSSIVTITVSKKDHTLCFSPFDLKPGEKKFGLTRWEISRKYD